MCRRFATCSGGRGGACVRGWTARSAPIITCGERRAAVTITRTLTATCPADAADHQLVDGDVAMASTSLPRITMDPRRCPVPDAGANCCCLRLLRGDCAAVPERAGRAVRVAADHGHGQPSAAATASCLTACAGPQDPSRSPNRAQPRCCDADRSIWGCSCSISDSYRAFGGSRLGVLGAVAAIRWRCCWRRPSSAAQAHEGHDHGPSESRRRAGRAARLRAFRDFRARRHPARRAARHLSRSLRHQRAGHHRRHRGDDRRCDRGGERRVGRGGHLRPDVAAVPDRGADRAGVLDHRRSRARTCWPER